MKKCILFLSAAVLAFTIQSCAKINGDGPVVTETRNVSGFTSINAGIAGTVYFTPGNDYKVEIHAQKNIIDAMNTRVSGGELKLEIDYRKHLGRHDRIEVYITAPDITGLTVSGSCDIKVMQLFQPQDLDLKISGSGAITIPDLQTSYLHAKISGSGDVIVNDGAADREKVEISGSGDVDLLNLLAHTSETHTSGSGTTKVNVSESLDVHVSGSGDVFYKGTPTVTASISGSGKVKPW